MNPIIVRVARWTGCFQLTMWKHRGLPIRGIRCRQASVLGVHLCWVAVILEVPLILAMSVLIAWSKLIYVGQETGGDSPKTPARRKPYNPQGSIARERYTADTPCSPAVRRGLRYNDNSENTPPRALREHNNPHNTGEMASPRVHGHHKQGASPAKSDLSSSQCSKESPGGGHKRSNSVDIRKMQNLFKTAAEDNIKSIRAYVTELKERVAKLQYQKQLLVCQVSLNYIYR